MADGFLFFDRNVNIAMKSRETMGKKKAHLSIVTPTYNRAGLLQKCYESLRAQTCWDFEWIIVNDGSTDDTEKVMHSFSNDHFPIYCISKPNGGKHTALNASHAHIHGDYVLILDSDDYLVPTAVEQVLDGWNRYADDNDIGMVIFLKGSAEDQPNCKAADEDEYTPIDDSDYKRICIKSSDCCEVVRSSLFNKYPFPVFDGERFIGEGTLWDRVNDDAKSVYINKVIYICEYLEGGLTKSGRRMYIRNPRGGMYNSNLGMRRKHCLKRRIKCGLLYTSYGYFAGIPMPQMAGTCSAPVLMFLCLPFGWALYLFWKKKYMKD